ncbi:MAG: ethanolamine utilization protein EutQ, partial [Carnobacterium sp.]
MLERIVREVIMEQMTKGKADTKTVDPSGVLSIKLPQLDVSEEDRLDT